MEIGIEEESEIGEGGKCKKRVEVKNQTRGVEVKNQEKPGK